MLRGLFGSKDPDKPTPPKNQIEVVCPACGAAQFEPRLVVSTFCRKCGVHLSIHKKKVVASSVTRSGAAGVDDLWNQSGPKPAAPIPTAQGTDHSLPAAPASPPAPAPAPADDSNNVPESARAAAQEGFGAFLQAGATPPPAGPTPPPSPDSPSHLVPLRKQASPPPQRLQPAAPQPSTLQQMREQGVYRQQYFKDVVCFECNHDFKVGRSAKTSNCPQCGVSVCLEDVEVNMNSTQPIRTRGDVIVRKRGHIATSRIDCKDLRCFGTVTANIHCTGDAIFKTEGKVIGEVICKQLIIEKGADVVFSNDVRADHMEINAHVIGNLHATGRIVIASHGAVDGDVTARAVSIEPGGELNGGMNIIRQGTPVGPLPSIE